MNRIWLIIYHIYHLWGAVTIAMCIEFDLIFYLEPKKFVNLINIRATNIELMKQVLGSQCGLGVTLEYSRY